MAIEWVMTLMEMATNGIEIARKLNGGEVLARQLEFFKEQLEIQEKALTKNEEKLRNAEIKVADLEFELARKWLQYNGALFLRLPSGKIDHSVYCPICRSSVLADFDPYFNERTDQMELSRPNGRYRCPNKKCGWGSDIIGSKESLIREVIQEYGEEACR